VVVEWCECRLGLTKLEGADCGSVCVADGLANGRRRGTVVGNWILDLGMRS